MLARVALAAALVGWLLHTAGVERITAALEQARFAPLAAGFVMIFIMSCCKIWNWQQLLRALGISGRRSFRRLFGCYFAGGLLGTVVPSTAGTDAIRAMLSYREFGRGISGHLAAVVVLNIMSLFAACVLGLLAAGALSMNGAIPSIARLAAPLFFAVTAGALTVYGLLKYRRGWWLWLLALTPRVLYRVRRPIRRFADKLLVFEKAHARFLPTFFMALLAQSFYALAIALCGLAIGVHLPWEYWVICGPLVALAALIPASVSGFGGDQVAMVYIMGLANVAPAAAFIISLQIAVINLTMNAALGGLMLLAGSRADLMRAREETSKGGPAAQ